jgi:Raf kinase inhibitor-like YbhB/YbcL family protein
MMRTADRRWGLTGWVATTTVALLLMACDGAGKTSKALVIDKIEAQRTTPLNPSSMSLATGGAFAQRQSAYAENLSPSLSWATTPGAKSYVVIIEDPDSVGGYAFLHWMIWDIPGDAEGLREGVHPVAAPPAPSGAIQGMSGAHTAGYFGPHPPPGTGVHHYHVELFALDTALALKATAGLPALEAAMHGHVLAKGQLVATYAAPR